MTIIFNEEKLVRVFIGEGDRLGDKPLYEVLLLAAKDNGAGGCTLLRGVESFGKGGELHTARLLRLAENLPLVIEIVVANENLDSLLMKIDEIMEESESGGLVTFEKIKTKRY